MVVIVVSSAWAVWQWAGQERSGAGQPQAGTVVHRVRSGDLEILVLSPAGRLQQGRNAFSLEFRSAVGASLVDVGLVRATANMTMPGMVMPSGMEVRPSGVPGRYEGTADFGMAGAWPISVEWDGPRGRGSVSFEGNVQ
jgi:hypothetical protein